MKLFCKNTQRSKLQLFSKKKNSITYVWQRPEYISELGLVFFYFPKKETQFTSQSYRKLKNNFTLLQDVLYAAEQLYPKKRLFPT